MEDVRLSCWSIFLVDAASRLIIFDLEILVALVPLCGLWTRVRVRKMVLACECEEEVRGKRDREIRTSSVAFLLLRS